MVQMNHPLLFIFQLDAVCHAIKIYKPVKEKMKYFCFYYVIELEMHLFDSPQINNTKLKSPSSIMRDGLSIWAIKIGNSISLITGDARD